MSNFQGNLEALTETLVSLEGLRILPKNLTLPVDQDSVVSGYGEVRCGMLADPATSRVFKVAVKELRPVGNRTDRARVGKRLAREAKVWAALKHPNILPLVGFYLNDAMTIAQLISPFESYGHIAGYLEETKPDDAERLRLATDTIEGLNHLHSLALPICHGDLKSHNILVSADRRAMLCDFGLSTVISEFPSGLTTSRGFKGTMRYLSPELMMKAQFCRTLEGDIWAWSCVLVEITCSVSPYFEIAVDSRLIIALVVERELPARLEGLHLPYPLLSLIKRCWSMEPGLRPTARECLNVLHIVASRSWTDSEGDSELNRRLGDGDPEVIWAVTGLGGLVLFFFF